MNINNFEIRIMNLNLNYFDNRVDNDYTPLDYNNVAQSGTTTIQYLLRTQSTPLTNCRLNLTSIEGGGTILTATNLTNYDSIILRDKRSDYCYVYFITDTGRIFNELYEYQIQLNYYATYGEQFLFGNSTRKLWHKMVNYKSNQIPIPSSSYDGVRMGLTNPDIQKWTWMNQSVSELPKNLSIEHNNETVVQYDPNIFKATYVPTNRLFSNATISNLQRFHYGLYDRPGIKSFNINALGQSQLYEVIYNFAHWDNSDSSNFGKWNIRIKNQNYYTDSKLITILNNSIKLWDTDTWLLLIPNIVVGYNGRAAIVNDGEKPGPFDSTNDNSITLNQNPIIIAVPISQTPQDYINNDMVALLKTRFGCGGFNLLGITKLKSQNWFQNQKPRRVILLSTKDFDMDESYSTRSDYVIACPVFTSVNRLSNFGIPNIYRNFGWYHRIYTQINVSNWQWASVPKNVQQIIGTIKLCSGVTRAVLNTGNSWIIYDWTKFNTKQLDVFYTNMGYEMMWIEPNFDEQNPYQTWNLRPWKENKMSLGMNAIHERNLGTFNNEGMKAIKANANQWQVALNQAQYNFDQSKKRYDVNLVDSTLGLNPFNSIMNVFKMITKPGDLANKEMNLAQSYKNAEFDTKKLPAMMQDLENSNTGSYPAGDSWLFDWEVPGLWVVEWNTAFMIDVYNYVTRNGWYNRIQNWNNLDLKLQYASALLYANNINSYNISGYFAFAQFYRDLNQITRNVVKIAKEYGIRVSNQVIEWFADWFDKGIRIYYQADERTRKTTYTLEQLKEVAKCELIVKSDANEREDKICDQERKGLENQNQEPKSRKSRSSKGSKSGNARTSKTNIKS